MLRTVDWDRLSGEVVRAVRGARTQKALSRALGYQGNVLFAWESAREKPTVLTFFRLLRQQGRDPERWLATFQRGQVPLELETPSGLGAYLRSLSEARTISDLSAALGRSRYVISRWLSGKTEIQLPAFFEFVEFTTLSVLDLIAGLADPRELPTARSDYLRMEAARRSARERPWSHAIVHMVELPSYRKLAKHQQGWFASRLGISTQEETDCLELLVQLGRLTVTDGRYQSTAALAVDTRPDPDATRQLAAFWMRAGAEKALIAGSGRYAFNTFGVSLMELARLQELQSRYFRELRAIVSDSTETEAVAVATFQLFTLTTEPPSSDEAC